MNERVSVAIHPFWRYAVGPKSGHSPAIPYMRLASAEQFFDEARCALPWSVVVLYRRVGWRGIEVLKESVPALSSESPDTEHNP